MIPDLLKDLNPKQQQAVLHTNGPALILAGAGSGKTKVLTHRTVNLILHNNVEPYAILLMTFTNKAAAEMKQRIEFLLHDGQRGNTKQTSPYAGTFHSFCVRMLRIHGYGINLPNNFVIYDDQDQSDAVKQIMKELDISIKSFNPNAIRHTISSAKNELISAEEYTSFARGYFQETVAQIYRAYDRLLKDNIAVDFDDILLLSVKLLLTQPEIRAQYQTTYRYIMIDEYQDTNKAQYELSLLLSNEEKNITVVGDASQSIYRWRGADFRNITNFKRDFPQAREYHLDQNYRSTQPILDAAYGVISHNTTHPILELWTEKQTGQKITLYEARNEHDEAAYIIQTILQSGRSLKDIAILYRTNAQSRVLEEAFLHAGVPYVLIGGTRFYERKEIKDVLAYMRYLSNPKDSVSLRRIEKIGKTRMKKFMTFAHTLQKETTLVELTTLELLDQTVAASDYLSLYDANSEEEAYRLENIKELRSVASEFPDLSTFLENVALVEREYEPDTIKARDAQRNAVTMMTIHSAKGLEFSCVFLVGMEEGLFPHSRALMDKEELEEERRLCYVGITRAKEALYLSYAAKRLFFGTRTQNMISRFIGEIPETVLHSQVSLSADRGFREDDLLI
jgi:DNA helicase II / ATP-dependent DNA helicase PcrA